MPTTVTWTLNIPATIPPADPGTDPSGSGLPAWDDSNSPWGLPVHYDATEAGTTFQFEIDSSLHPGAVFEVTGFRYARKDSSTWSLAKYLPYQGAAGFQTGWRHDYTKSYEFHYTGPGRTDESGNGGQWPPPTTAPFTVYDYVCAKKRQYVYVLQLRYTPAGGGTPIDFVVDPQIHNDQE